MIFEGPFPSFGGAGAGDNSEGGGYEGKGE